MLEIQSLSVNYGSHAVLRDVSISVAPGEIVALIGPNGAGKTTLIRAISCIVPISGGTVRVNGKDVASVSSMQRARWLAVVTQARQLPGDFTVYQTVLLGRTPYMNWLGHAGSSDHLLVRWAMEKTQLMEMSDRHVGELSGGEQQRVLLARALAQNAPILLLDEPTTHLDLQHQSNLLNLIRKLCYEKNLTILVVLHDLNLASLYADRVALLVNGRIHSSGDPKDVLTSRNLTSVYQVPVHVITHPEYGTPLVLPDGRGSR